MNMEWKSFDELPLVLSVENLMSLLGIGRQSAYQLVRSNQIRSVRIGKQIRIPKDAVQEYLNSTGS